MRTVCPECQTQSAVGVVCPECMKQQKAERSPAQRKADRRWGRSGGGSSILASSAFRELPVTYSILAITIVISVLQMVPGLDGPITGSLLFAGVYLSPETIALGMQAEPWRAFTTALVHGGILHLMLNMLSLFMVGRVLEPMIGKGRFLTLYLISTFAGSLAVALIAPLGQPVVGASGAIFGTFGALIIIVRSLGGDVRTMGIIILVNFAYGFFVARVAWEAHLGGLIGGLAVGAIYAATRKRSQRTTQILLLVGLCVLLVGLVFLIPVFHPLVPR